PPRDEGASDEPAGRVLTMSDDGPGFDYELIEEGVRTILKGIGEDPDRPGLADTPRRVAEMCKEIFAGIGHEASEVVTVIPGADHDEMIMVRDIPFASYCEHHLVPFTGKAAVAYVPTRAGRLTGLSQIARLVDLPSTRL